MSEEPRRLSHDPDWAADVAAVKAARPDPNVLLRVERRLQVDLRGGASPRSPWIRLRWAILVVVFGGATAVAAVGRERWWPAPTEAPVSQPQRPIRRAPPPLAEVADAAPPAESTPGSEPEVPSAVKVTDAAPPTDPTPSPQPEAVVRPRPRLRPEAPKVTADPPPPAPSPVDDPLAAQLSALKETQANLQSGDAAAALRGAEALLERHPTGPVAPEARVLRVQAWAAVGQVDLAVAGARALVGDPTQRGRRGEWWRFIGDLERGRGRCPAALEAYRAAASFHLKPASKLAVEAGVRACGGAP